MKVEKIGNQTLILGDCLQVMPTLGRFGHVISDPPYEKEAHRSDRRVQRRDGLVAGALQFEEIGARREPVCHAAVNVCDGWLIFFCQAEGVAPWRDALEAAGAKYKAPMIWVKPDGMPQFNGQGPGMGYESMVSAWCGRGHSRWNGGGRHGVFIVPKGEGVKPEHQTQKPVRLMSDIVALFSNPQDTILDPFMGSGTTLVACQRMGRHGTGIEIDKDYWEIACRRVEEAARQPDLFIPETRQQPQQTGFDL